MPSLPENTVIGKYRIEQRVGAGGMGEVYRATNLLTRLPVAVKTLTRTGGSDTALARFRNEAVIQYNLHHPNVAELYEYFEYQGQPCIVMEFVEGQTLSERIREAGPLPVPKALEILADICDAVSYMHSKGTIHRDIKSENIRITPQGKAKLLDFGISVSRTTPALTKIGFVVGTPEKMAPEQHQGLRGDARSDVWSLGVLLYEMATGAQPFSNTDPLALREDIMATRFIPAHKRRQGLPKPVLRMISTCLKMRADERYASAGVMLQEIQQARRRMGGGAWKATIADHPLLVAGAVILMLVIAILIYSLSSTPPGNSGRDFQAPPSRPQAPADTLPAPRPTQEPPRRAEPAAPKTELLRADLRTVWVTTYDGPAEVVGKDGRVLGSTPYPLSGPVGMNYELLLRREGYQPHRIDVQIVANRKEYLFGLERNESRSDYGKKE